MGIIPNRALCSVLREIEEEDAIWQAKSRKNQKQSSEGSVSKGDAGASLSLAEYPRAENAGEQRIIRAARQPQSSRDYGA